MLLENVWDYHFDPQTNVIDSHVSKLRRKIDAGFDMPLLHTVRGAGISSRHDAVSLCALDGGSSGVWLCGPVHRFVAAAGRISVVAHGDLSGPGN